MLRDVIQMFASDSTVNRALKLSDDSTWTWHEHPAVLPYQFIPFHPLIFKQNLPVIYPLYLLEEFMMGKYCFKIRQVPIAMPETV